MERHVTRVGRPMKSKEGPVKYVQITLPPETWRSGRLLAQARKIGFSQLVNLAVQHEIQNDIPLLLYMEGKR